MLSLTNLTLLAPPFVLPATFPVEIPLSINVEADGASAIDRGVSRGGTINASELRSANTILRETATPFAI